MFDLYDSIMYMDPFPIYGVEVITLSGPSQELEKDFLDPEYLQRHPMNMDFR